MPADIRTEAQRDIRLDHLLGTFAVGSALWSWRDEYDDLMKRDSTEMEVLIASIRADGIREPILLGSDGRVWDGHHRICAAMHLGLDTVPVEFCTQTHVTPTREQITEVLIPLIREHNGADENDSWWVADHACDYTDAVLALMQKLAEKGGA